MPLPKYFLSSAQRPLMQTFGHFVFDLIVKHLRQISDARQRIWMVFSHYFLISTQRLSM